MASWEKFSRIVAEAKASKKLDPVGHEDADVNNDGVSDSSDSYLKKRRAAVGAAIDADKKKKVEEAKQLDPVGQEDEDIDNDGDSDSSDRYLLNRRKVRSKIIQREEVEQIDEFIDALASKVGPVIDKGVNAVFGKPKPKLTTPTVSKPSTTSITPKPTPVPPKKTFADVGREVRSNIDTRNQRLQQAINQSRGLSNSYQPEGQLVDEGKADKKLPEHKRSAARLARYDNPSGALALGGGQQRARRAEHEERRGVKKEEFVGEGVKGENNELRRAAADERRQEKNADKEFKSSKRGEKKKGPKLSTTPHTEGQVKNYADRERDSVKWYNKVSKGKHNIPGYAYAEETEYEIEEGMSMKDFKANRKKNERKATSADAENRGHVGKEWHNTGRKYSPDEAKSRRAKMSDDDRRSRYGSAEDPDSEDYSHYPAAKTKDPKKLRKQKAMGEGYLQEKALSRAQQRFFGMVRSEQEGKMKNASPEVKSAAQSMTKKQAHDFAATKHEGLPEKKEETKEEFSLIDRMIENFSPLSEGKLDDLLADIRGEDGGDKKKDSPKKKTEQERKTTAKKQVKRGKSDPSALTRRAAVAGAARLKAEKEKTLRQRERQEYEKGRRAEKTAQRLEKEKEKQERLEASYKEKRIKSAQQQSDREETRNEKGKREVKSAVVGALKTIRGPQAVSDKAKGSTGATVDSYLDSAGSVVSAVGKGVRGVIATKMKQRKEQKQKQQRQERHEKIRSEISK